MTTRSAEASGGPDSLVHVFASSIRPILAMVLDVRWKKVGGCAVCFGRGGRKAAPLDLKKIA